MAIPKIISPISEKVKEPGTPAVAAEAPESTTPIFESEADIDRRLTESLMREAQEEREREEARVRRQMGARSLADLGGVFTDMIKASQGAVVSPRDVDAHYNRLDERQKEIVKNYHARVDLARKNQEERERLRRAAAQRAAERQQDHDWQNELWEKQKQFQAEEAEKDRRHREAEAERSRQHETNLTYINGRRSNEDKQYYIDFGDVNGQHVVKDFQNKTRIGKNVYAAIYQYLRAYKLIPDSVMPVDNNGYILEYDDQPHIDTLVREYMYDAMREPVHKNEIYKIVYGRNMPGYSTAPGTVSAASVTQSGFRPFTPNPGVSTVQTPAQPSTSSGTWYNMK